MQDERRGRKNSIRNCRKKEKKLKKFAERKIYGGKLESIRKYFAYGGKWESECYIPSIHDHFYYNTMLVTVTGEFRGMKSIHDYVIPAFDINELARLVDEAQEENIKSVVIKAIGMDKDIRKMLDCRYEDVNQGLVEV